MAGIFQRNIFQNDVFQVYPAPTTAEPAAAAPTFRQPVYSEVYRPPKPARARHRARGGLDYGGSGLATWERRELRWASETAIDASLGSAWRHSVRGLRAVAGGGAELGGAGAAARGRQFRSSGASADLQLWSDSRGVDFARVVADDAEALRAVAEVLGDDAAGLVASAAEGRRGAALELSLTAMG